MRRLLLLLALITIPVASHAQVRLSAYAIGTAVEARHGTIRLTGTLALPMVGTSNTGNYTVEAGFWFAEAASQPNVEVSWQVTGIRHDPWAETNRIVVEEDKPPDEQGFYLHPRLYGQPERQGIGWIEEDEAMRRQLDEQRQRLDEQRPSLPRPQNCP